MTKDTRAPTDASTRGGQTLRDVSHTHPYTGQVFGKTQTFDRGRRIAADGGRRGGVSSADGDATGTAAADDDQESTGDDAGETDADGRRETMADVDHTPRNDSQGVNHVYDDRSPRDDPADE